MGTVFKNLVDYELPKVVIEITHKCNYNCVHCYNNSYINHNFIQDINLLKELLLFLKEEGFKRLVISGGEPFLVPELLFKLLDFSIELFGSISIITNGSLVHNYISKLEKYKKYIDLFISIHSNDKDYYDWFTGTKSHLNRVIKTLKTLKKRKIDFRLGMQITQKNMYNLNEIGEFFAKELKNDKLKICCSFNMFKGRAKKTPYMRMSDDETKYIHEQIKKQNILYIGKNAGFENKYQKCIFNKDMCCQSCGKCVEANKFCFYNMNNICNTCGICDSEINKIKINSGLWLKRNNNHLPHQNEKYELSFLNSTIIHTAAIRFQYLEKIQSAKHLKEEIFKKTQKKSTFDDEYIVESIGFADKYLKFIEFKNNKIVDLYVEDWDKFM